MEQLSDVARLGVIDVMTAELSGQSAVHRKLGITGQLDDASIGVLDNLVENSRTLSAGATLVGEDQFDGDAYVLLSGWAFRYRIFEDGRRQISRLFLPGDFIGLHPRIAGLHAFPIETLTEVRVAKFNVEWFISELQRSRQLLLSFMRSDIRDRMITEERVASIGRRSAYQRMAHLMVELYFRLEMVGAAENDVFTLPLTQEQLADLVGLTSIHVNRTLNGLKRDDLVSMQGRLLRLLDRNRLMAIADFDTRYLMHEIPPSPFRSRVE